MLNEQFILVFDANLTKITNFTEKVYYRPIEKADPIELSININILEWKFAWFLHITKGTTLDGETFKVCKEFLTISLSGTLVNI